MEKKQKTTKSKENVFSFGLICFLVSILVCIIICMTLFFLDIRILIQIGEGSLIYKMISGGIRMFTVAIIYLVLCIGMKESIRESLEKQTSDAENHRKSYLKSNS